MKPEQQVDNYFKNGFHIRSMYFNVKQSNAKCEMQIAVRNASMAPVFVGLANNFITWKPSNSEVSPTAT